jgi:hypothetical protein
VVVKGGAPGESKTVRAERRSHGTGGAVARRNLCGGVRACVCGGGAPRSAASVDVAPEARGERSGGMVTTEGERDAVREGSGAGLAQKKGMDGWV